MKHSNWIICLLFFCACVPLVGFGSLPREQYDRSVELSAPMESGMTFSAETPNGSITVHGSKGEEVRVTATIEARAVKSEKARELAEATTVELVSGKGGVEAKIDCPRTGGNKSIRVELDVYLPADSSVDVQSHNGDITVEDCSGDLKVRSHNGRILARNTTGNADLQTHNGRISCDDISGDIELVSHNGHIRAVYRENADPAPDISITTHNGGIELVAPPDFSAAVQVSTRNGAIETDLPISVVGKMGRNSLNGTIGAGEGRLHLEADNGAIEIR